MATIKKKPWQSKTVWANFIMAGMAFFPFIADKLTPEQVMMGMAAINMALRMITKDKVALT